MLQYHVISDSVKAGDLKDSQVVKTLNGMEVAIIKRGGAVYVNDANLKVITADVIGSNGIVHVRFTTRPKSRTMRSKRKAFESSQIDRRQIGQRSRELDNENDRALEILWC